MTVDRRCFVKNAALTVGSFVFEPLHAFSKELPEYFPLPSRVSLITGVYRREIILQALEPFRELIKAGVTGKQVVIKPNVVWPQLPLAVTHLDALRAVLDFVSPFTHRQIIIGESSSIQTVSTEEVFKYYNYYILEKEYNVKVHNLSNGLPYTQAPWIKHVNGEILQPRVSSLVLDPSKYLISLAVLKTHSATVCTMAMKNFAMGSTMNFPPGHPLYNPKENDRSLMHYGGACVGLIKNLIRMSCHYIPDFSIIDGFQGMEGNGPGNGTPVDHRVVIAGPDTISVDRVGLELMGANYNDVKLIQWAASLGLGQGDLEKIRVIGSGIEQNKKKYKMHQNFLDQIAFISSEPTWAGDELTTPPPFSLSCNPSRFDTTTTVEFNLPASDSVTLEIYNAQNENVREIVNSYVRRGRHSFIWDALDAQGRKVPGGSYYARAKTPLYDASSSLFYTSTLAAGDERDTPQALSISSHPNPFNASTAIEFILLSDGFASLEIYDSQGRRVRQLVSSHLNAGKQTFTWNGVDDWGREVATGAYFAYLRTALNSMSNKIMFLK
ncbi:MAG: DUF362 domain-containing protein [Candidatus Latescibacterota bacterium]